MTTSDEGTALRTLSLLRKLLIAAGLGSVAFALLVDVARGNAISFGFLQTVLIVFGAALLLIGVLGRNTVTVYKTFAILTLNTVLLLLAVELGAGVMLRLRPGRSTGAEPTRSYYRNQAWGPDYAREYTTIHGRKRYEPYVVWRTPPFQGKQIVVDERGRRRTVGSDCAAGAYRVFAFGGSTMWGVGSPDWGTIPSYLAAELAQQRGRPVCVENYGEHGFVSTQGVVQLIKELEAGNVPDLVIFYDGINDIYSTVLLGQAGLHYELPLIKARFERSEPRFAGWLRRRNIYRVVAPRLAAPEKPGPALPADAAQAVVRTYLNNHAIVAALGQSYGFDYRLFWQPNLLVGAKPRTAYEEKVRTRMQPEVVALTTAVHELIGTEATKRSHLYDLTHGFDAETGELYIDWMHVIPEGNRILARAIAATLIDAGRAKQSE